MDALQEGRLLAAWEDGLPRSRSGRALALLRAAGPGASGQGPYHDDARRAIGELANLSIGKRDARLLRLRRSTFGSPVDAVVSCPSCAAKLEFGFGLQDVEIGGSDHSACSELLSLCG